MPNRANRSPRARVLTAAAIALPVVVAAAIVQTKAFAAPNDNGGDNSKNTDLKSYVCTYVYANDLWKLRVGNQPALEKNTVLLNTRDTSATTYVGEIFNQGIGQQSVKLYVLVANVTDKTKPTKLDVTCPETLPGPSSSATTPTSPATTPTSPATTPTGPVTSELPPSGSPTTSVTTPTSPVTTPTNPETTPTNPVTSETPPPATSTTPTPTTSTTTPTSPTTSVTAPPATSTTSTTSPTSPATSLPKTGN